VVRIQEEDEHIPGEKEKESRGRGMKNKTYGHIDYLKTLLEYYYPYHFFALFRAHELYNVAPFVDLLKPPVLDFGCGDGYISKLLFGRQIDFGLDASEEAVLTAIKSGAYWQVFHADAHDIPLESNSLGGVFSNCALEHIPRLDECIREVARVLKPGAYIVATVLSPSYYILNPVFRELDRSGLRWLRHRMIRAENALHNHVSVFAPETYAEMFAESGMKLEKQQYYCPGEIAAFCSMRDTLSKYIVPYPAHLTHSGLLSKYMILRYGKRPRERQLNSWLEKFHAICYQRNESNDMGVGQIIVARKQPIELRPEEEH
jgi:SAM-dependent methyltransferase